MQTDPTFMIIAGEVSGDMHAAPLVRAIRARMPQAHFFGIGGERMRAAGVETFYGTDDMAVMGVSEVVRRYGFFRRVFNDMLRLAADRRPDAVILVDYPGFNLRLARRLHERGLHVIYYICPQVWAWNRGRIPRMAEIVDRLITIFPFEAEHFNGTGLRVSFAGHPLVPEAAAALAAPESPLPWQGTPRVALLPGSRRHEIERLLPAMCRAAARILRTRPEASFLIAAPAEAGVRLIEDVVRLHALPMARTTIVPGATRQILRQADAAIVASGTATIEAALMRCPMVVVYRTAWLTYFLGRLLIRVPHIGMVNIVAGNGICPELIQSRVTPARLAHALSPLLDDSPQRRRMVAELERVAAALGEGRAAENAADLVVRELEGKLSA